MFTLAVEEGGLSHHAYEITIAYSLVYTITYLYG